MDAPPVKASPSVKALIREWSLPIRKNVLDLGVFGHAEYTPFVVLGRSRVGSNLLRSVLNAHPEVVAFGEIFRDLKALDWDHVGYFQHDSIRALVQRDPVRFLETRVLGRYPKAIQAVGFKLFYYHARDGVHAGIWPWLQQRREIKVIHLKRGNLLQTHVSRKRASLTGKWVNTSGEPDQAVTLRLDYHEVLSDFEQTRAWEAEADRAFASHPLLQVQYGQLVADVQSEANRLAEFLGVSPHLVRPSTFQQSVQPLSATIANYQELKAQFAGTPWVEFFAE
jgi:LPS sulfotransferase NodH